MTCVVGWIDKTKTGSVVHMAADSQGSDEYDKVTRKDAKIFRVGDFLIGGCGSYRMIQLLRYSDFAGGIRSLEPPRGPSLERWMVATFIEKCREILENGGYTRIEDNVEEGGMFLVGTRGRLFVVDSDFHVGESGEMLDAIGVGGNSARASMLTVKRLGSKMSPRAILKMALEVSAEMHNGIGPPYKFMSI